MTHFCDTCGQPATRAARDIHEIEPTICPDGIAWAQWAPASQWRYGCEAHRPPSRIITRHENQAAYMWRQHAAWTLTYAEIMAAVMSERAGQAAAAQ